jgi:hypothetical protein
VEQPELQKGANMEPNIPCGSRNIQTIPSRRPLRAIIEIDAGELKIIPLADSDYEEKLILDALRFVREDFHQ